jgi:hypothetical protein
VGGRRRGTCAAIRERREDVVFDAMSTAAHSSNVDEDDHDCSDSNVDDDHWAKARSVANMEARFISVRESLIFS